MLGKKSHTLRQSTSIRIRVHCTSILKNMKKLFAFLHNKNGPILVVGKYVFVQRKIVFHSTWGREKFEYICWASGTIHFSFSSVNNGCLMRIWHAQCAFTRNCRQSSSVLGTHKNHPNNNRKNKKKHFSRHKSTKPITNTQIPKISTYTCVNNQQFTFSTYKTQSTAIFTLSFTINELIRWFVSSFTQTFYS